MTCGRPKRVAPDGRLHFRGMEIEARIMGALLPHLWALLGSRGPCTGFSPGGGVLFSILTRGLSLFCSVSGVGSRHCHPSLNPQTIDALPASKADWLLKQVGGCVGAVTVTPAAYLSA